MAQLAKLPDDLVFYTQITMEAAEDPAFLDAMTKAHIRGALVGVESVTVAMTREYSAAPLATCDPRYSHDCPGAARYTRYSVMPKLGVTEPDAKNIAAYLYTLK